jgi:hypothetical protein
MARCTDSASSIDARPTSASCDYTIVSARNELNVGEFRVRLRSSAKEVCSAPQFLLESITVTANYPKRACQAPLFRMESSIVNPIPFRVVDADKKMNTFGFVRPAPTNFTHEEVEILELLLLK